ncbi:MAG TPA: YebC/PmpR family DNA-binding transcriptional regulator [Actinomycetota bacterium]|nr:YebC/PmpR family DNA-binding transcriptional regulator [Actinomycetota bacterium]
MSGHSKWATIKRKKEATDTKRSNMYAKLLRAVEVAAREGGGSIEGNMTLASAVEKAKSFSVPNDNIERAIKRGTGDDSGGARYEEVTYEGYGPGGVAMLVETLTDNRNRTAQEVRHAFTRHNGNLGEAGSTAWMFARKGAFLIEKAVGPDEEQLLEIALEAGADDLTDSESTWEITTDPSAFRTVRDAFEAAGIPMVSAELTMVPQSTVPVEGAQAKSVLALLESLEDLDDVQNVYANFDIPEEVMASL